MRARARALVRAQARARARGGLAPGEWMDRGADDESHPRQWVALNTGLGLRTHGTSGWRWKERVLVLGVVDNSPHQTHQHGHKVLAVERHVRRNLPRNFGEHSHSEFRPLELQG